MIKYILKRIVLIIPILLAVGIMIFTLMYFVPGDPVSIALGNSATQEEIEAIKTSKGLNDPYMVQLGRYLGNLVFHLDMGTSYKTNMPVSMELLSRFPNTMKIALSSIVLTMLIGIPIGIRAAIKANTFEDRLSMFVSLLGTALPNFWMALLLILLFSVTLKWFPSNGDKSWKYFVLPAISNSIGSIAMIARQTRASMLEVIRSDYVVTARAKGVPERKVILGHALPNALIPIITVCGGSFGMLLGGAIITESVFSISGIGTYLLTGINSRDYNVVQGSVLYIAATFAVLMLIIDVLYAYVDPRIKAQYVQSGRKGKENGKKGK